MQIRFGLVTAVLVIVTELLCLALTSQQHGLQDAFTGNLPHRHDPLTHYFLSRYSPGTSSCGTSCVRTSAASASSASSTPFTTSASNAFPSSSNSSTLSESAPWTLDNPCKSPDCSPGRAPSPSSPNATVSTLWCFPRTCSLSAPAVSSPIAFLPPAFVLTFAFFGAAFFFANFFLGVTLFLASLCLIAIFIGANFLPAVLFDFACFFLVFFLVAIRAVYHRSYKSELSRDIFPSARLRHFFGRVIQPNYLNVHSRSTSDLTLFELRPKLTGDRRFRESFKPHGYSGKGLSRQVGYVRCRCNVDHLFVIANYDAGRATSIHTQHDDLRPRSSF